MKKRLLVIISILTVLAVIVAVILGIATHKPDIILVITISLIFLSFLSYLIIPLIIKINKKGVLTPFFLKYNYFANLTFKYSCPFVSAGTLTISNLIGFSTVGIPLNETMLAKL